jgi:hypothetical protein
MKHGYVCQCGWRLDRGDLTRKSYAIFKEIHAKKCILCANEIRKSRNLPLLDKNESKPYSVGA